MITDEDASGPPPSYRALGWVTLTVAIGLIAVDTRFGCAPQAIAIGGFSFVDGVALGCALAFITRTMRPPAIYALLAVAALTMWPIATSWPPDDIGRHAYSSQLPDPGYFYLDALRTLCYILGFPYAFARLGHHAADPLPRREEAGEEADRDDGENDDKDGGEESPETRLPASRRNK